MCLRPPVDIIYLDIIIVWRGPREADAETPSVSLWSMRAFREKRAGLKRCIRLINRINVEKIENQVFQGQTNCGRSHARSYTRHRPVCD